MNNVIINNGDYVLSKNEDRIMISKTTDEFTYGTSIRWQDFGSVYRFNPQACFIKIEILENTFRPLVFNELDKYYDDSVTLMSTVTQLSLDNSILDCQISSIENLTKYFNILNKYINDLNLLFFEPMQNKYNIAHFIAKYSYQNILEVNVGSRFPISVFKKIFLLYIGNEKYRYSEYKNGLYNQIENISVRKPHKKEESRIYLKNLNLLINKLEQEF